MRFGIFGGGGFVGVGGIRATVASLFARGQSDHLFVSKLNPRGGLVGHSSCASGKSRCNSSLLNLEWCLLLAVCTQATLSTTARKRALKSTANFKICLTP